MAPRRTLDAYPGAWDRPRGLLSLRPHPTIPLRLRRPLGRSGTVGSERFVRVVRQGVPNRAQRKGLHRAQEIPRDDETRRRPARGSLSCRRRPPADHPDGPQLDKGDDSMQETAGRFKTSHPALGSPGQQCQPNLQKAPFSFQNGQLSGQNDKRPHPPRPAQVRPLQDLCQGVAAPSPQRSAGGTTDASTPRVGVRGLSAAGTVAGP